MSKGFTGFLTVIMACQLLYSAQKIEITSKTFMADEKSRTTEFLGEVKVKKGIDSIESDRLVVRLNKKNEPVLYEAQGNVRFQLSMENGSRYKGTSNRAVYDSVKKEYRLLGNAKIKEMSENRELFGESIVVRQDEGTARVSGKNDKPVRFIFSVEEK